MKKTINVTLLLLATYCGTNKIYAQIKPLDTSFYQNRSIRSILFESDKRVDGYLVEVFYENLKSGNAKGRRIADTVYTQLQGWRLPEKINQLNRGEVRYARKYYEDGTELQKSGKIISNNYFHINEERLLFKENSILIQRVLDDSLVLGLSVSKWDTIAETNIMDFVEVHFKQSTYLKEQEYYLGEGKNIRILDYKNVNRLKTIYFENEKGLGHGKYIQFYPNQNLETYGNYNNGGRVGIWKEFYYNNQLKSVGNYNGKFMKDDNHNVLYFKDGEWLYFSEFGKLLKKEIYKDGILVKK
jgi:antitoxin component YwqK of YwqJK toxin-antitoxin module